MSEKEREIEIIYQELISNRTNILTETRPKVVMPSKTDTIREPNIIFKRENH